MFQLFNILSILPFLCSTSAAPSLLSKRQNNGCSAYTIINTRGTTEPQAESSGFLTMNKAIRSAIPNIETYNTVYPADSSQTSGKGTDDIISHITSILKTDPGHCFVLEGYSQGAKSTVQAMPSLSGEMFEAVKAVFLIGNPYHKAGLSCNVDLEGGGDTLNVDGKSLTADNAIPENWVGKTMDVCNKGDGVCDTTNGQKEIIDEHTAYQGSTKMQDMGADFVIKALNAVSTTDPSSAGSEEPGSTIASSSSESVLIPTSDRPVACTVPYSSSAGSSSASSSSSGATESSPAPSPDAPPAPSSNAAPTSSSDAAPVSTSDSPPAQSSDSSPTLVSMVVEPSPAVNSTTLPTPEVEEPVPTSVLVPVESSSTLVSGPAAPADPTDVTSRNANSAQVTGTKPMPAEAESGLVDGYRS